MFDTMVETRRAGKRARAVWPYPVAASAHFLVAGGMIAASLLILERAPDFDNPFGTRFLTIHLIPAPSLPPPPGEGGPPRGAPAALSRRPAEPREVVEPRDAEAATAAPELPDEGIEDAIPGVPRPGAGGRGTGWPWGVEGGFGDGSGNGLLGGDGRVEPGGTPVAVAVTPDMVPPVLVRRVQPRYPPLAIAARLPGFVVLQAVIGEDGGVEDVTVLRASSPLFAAPAIDAVRQWRYRAALQSGRPVRVYFTVRVEFQLK
jgi:protein TonB